MALIRDREGQNLDLCEDRDELNRTGNDIGSDGETDDDEGLRSIRGHSGPFAE